MSLPTHMALHLVLLEAVPVAVLVAAGRERLATVRIRPVAAGTAGTALVIAWHVPGLFDAALADPVLHQGEHASFVVAGLLLWAPVLSPGLSAAGALMFLFVTRNVQMVLGNVFLWAPSPLYRDSGSLHDQRLAGAIMLGEGLIAGIATGAWLFTRLLREESEAGAHRDVAGGQQQLARPHRQQGV
jgi:putative membrane protein